MREHNNSKYYDNAFHTLVQRTPELLIPLVNEIFQEDYHLDDEVIIQSSDLPTEDGSGEVKRRYSDSLFSIRGRETRCYHIECESRVDGSIVLRVVEYGLLKALRDARCEDGELIIKMPESAVIFLRHNHNTPDRFWVRIITPGGENRYPIEALKIGNYSVEELFRKDLLFLLPFHIFTYEKDFQEWDHDIEKIERLFDVYEEILCEIEKRRSMGELSVKTERVIISMIRHVMDGVTRNYTQIREEGSWMLGEVIDNEMTKMLDELDEVESKLDEAESKLDEAESKLDEAESKLDEVESKLGEAEAREDDLREAAKILTEKGRSGEIIRLFEDEKFLEDVLAGAE